MKNSATPHSTLWTAAILWCLTTGVVPLKLDPVEPNADAPTRSGEADDDTQPLKNSESSQQSRG